MRNEVREPRPDRDPDPNALRPAKAAIAAGTVRHGSKSRERNVTNAVQTSGPNRAGYSPNRGVLLPRKTATVTQIDLRASQDRESNRTTKVRVSGAPLWNSAVDLKIPGKWDALKVMAALHPAVNSVRDNRDLKVGRALETDRVHKGTALGHVVPGRQRVPKSSRKSD